MVTMEKVEELKRCCEKREEYGKTKSYTRGGSYNDYLEFEKYGELIIDTVMEMYRAGDFERR